MFEDEYRSMTVSDTPSALPSPQTQMQHRSKNKYFLITAENASSFIAGSRITKRGCFGFVVGLVLFFYFVWKELCLHLHKRFM